MAQHSRPWFYYFGNRVLRILIRVLLNLEVRGLENVPAEGPLIVAISHSSFLDPVLIGPVLPRDISPMTKVEAFDIPVIGLILRWYGAFAVRRGEVDLAAFKAALHILNSGSAMVIAPEGHRSGSGALQRGREGAIMLSLRSGAPILPVAVWGGKGFWSGLKHLRRTKMYLYIAEPVLPAISGIKPTRQRMAEMADELMVRIANMMPPELRGYYADSSKVTSHHLQTFRPSASAVPAALQQKGVVHR